MSLYHKSKSQHYTGKVYDLTQENMNNLIADLEMFYKELNETTLKLTLTEIALDSEKRRNEDLQKLVADTVVDCQRQLRSKGIKK